MRQWFPLLALADHRATFIDSVSHQKAWFDSFVANSR